MAGPDHVPETKQDLRRRLLDQRSALSLGEIQFRSEQVFRNFIHNAEHLDLKAAKTIGLYYPIRGEVDSRPIYDFLESHGHQCAFPRVENNRIAYHVVRHWDDLKISKFGIGEPSPQKNEAPVLPQLILVPGVAFSKDAYRLGFGAGHYDRLTEQWSAQGVRARIRMIGMAYDFQVLEAFPREAHDQRLDGVLTETQIYGTF